MRRLFEKDPLTGITRYWRHNPLDDTAYLETEQDVTAIMEANKRAFNDAENNWRGDMHRVATLPISLITTLQEQGIIDPKNDPKGVRFNKWLNLPENRVWRTKPGRL